MVSCPETEFLDLSQTVELQTLNG